MQYKYGLIGKSLQHSFSPAYFNDKFFRLGIYAQYTAYELNSIDAFPNLLQQHKQLVGLNVTIPYKEAIIPYLTYIDTAAQEINAVNCLKIKNKKIIGYNTDWLGFKISLQNLLQEHKYTIKQAIVLGNGGAAKAVFYALKQLDIPYLIISRNNDAHLHYNQLSTDIIQHSKLIINTTPVGMYPNIDDAFPIDSRLITSQHILYDLIYNPTITSFMKMGIGQGATVKNGLEMLHIQAEESWKIWQDDAF
jgi:shikimate dehydrogenase